MSSLAVEAGAFWNTQATGMAVNQKHGNRWDFEFSSFSKESVTAPIRSSDSVGLLGEGQVVMLFCKPLMPNRIRRRQSCQDSRVFALASPGENVATTAVEECSSSFEDYNVREASVAWSILSIFTALVLWELHWSDGESTRGQEYIKPRLQKLVKQSEPVRYWATVSCCLLLWLSAAFFLLSSTRAMAVSDLAFDSAGGRFCLSLWLNSGLGCQFSFT